VITEIVGEGDQGGHFYPITDVAGLLHECAKS